jgi:hypothetical protein
VDSRWRRVEVREPWGRGGGGGRGAEGEEGEGEGEVW